MNILQVKRGASRVVLLLMQRYAVKIPRFSEYRLFLYGLLANLQEREFGKAGWPELCPVIHASPLGLWVIMPYASPLGEKEWRDFDYDAFVETEHYHVPAENKWDSFGLLHGKVVAIDYGS